jgi:hypothetical protein
MRNPLNGRPSGITNRTRRGVEEACSKSGYDPLKSLIELIPYLGKEKQAQIHLEMMTYIYSKPKQDEAPPAPSNPWRDKPADELVRAIPITNAGSNK